MTEPVEIDANVGVLRDPKFLKDPKASKVANMIVDQHRIAGLLAKIPVSDGGRQGTFPPTGFNPQNGTCQAELANAIYQFQVHWKAKGVVPIIMGLVRPRGTTLAKLNELEALHAPKPPADAVVAFLGGTTAGPLTRGEILQSQFIQGYVELDGRPFDGAILRHPHDGRILVCSGRTTNTVGPASARLFPDVLADVLAKVAQAKAVLDRIYIYGSSSGGRNTIDFAQFLSTVPNLGLAQKLRVVATVDAAFFDSDSKAVRPNPTVTQGNKARDAGAIPKFNVVIPNGSYRKANFYQTFGNHAKRAKAGFGDWLFTSNMHGEEIHGEIDGFSENKNLDFSITRAASAELDSDDGYHVGAGTEGRKQARQMIMDDMRLGRGLP